MKTINVKYGIASYPANLDDYATFNELIHDRNIKAALGCGDNVRALVNGAPMPLDAMIPAGANVTLETAANQKAVPVALMLALGAKLKPV